MLTSNSIFGVLVPFLSFLQFYLRTGGCKFGKACRYNHTKEKSSAAPVLEFNFLGLPKRLVLLMYHFKSVVVFINQFLLKQLFTLIVNHFRERKSVPSTCVLAHVSMEQTAGLIILIQQLLGDMNLLQDMVMGDLFHYKVHHNQIWHLGLHQEH